MLGLVGTAYRYVVVINSRQVEISYFPWKTFKYKHIEQPFFIYVHFDWLSSVVRCLTFVISFNEAHFLWKCSSDFYQTFESLQVRFTVVHYYIFICLGWLQKVVYGTKDGVLKYSRWPWGDFQGRREHISVRLCSCM